MRIPVHAAGLLGSVAILLFISYNALALDPSGTTVAVIQATTATGPGGSRSLEPQRPIYSGDRINTAATGEAQIRFIDETRLVVGPNSSLLIDKFVFTSNQTAVNVSVRAVKGALRFISGNSPSRAYTIRTPTATLGVRGTQFDVAIGRNGETGLIVLRGAVRMCGRTGQCILVDEACGAAIALPNGRVAPVRSHEDRSNRIQRQFPYIVNQASLRRDFRADTRACGPAAASSHASLGFFGSFAAALSGVAPGTPGGAPGGTPGAPGGGPGNGNGNFGNTGNGGGNLGGSGPGTGNGGSNAGLGFGASNGGGGFGNGGFGGAGFGAASADARQ
jgi:hypothetical protein